MLTEEYCLNGQHLEMVYIGDHLQNVHVVIGVLVDHFALTYGCWNRVLFHHNSGRELVNTDQEVKHCE